MEGKIVNHKIFGEGAVVSLKDNFLTVKFQNEEKIFMFPACFENLLETEDRELSAYAELMLYNKKLEKDRKKAKGVGNRIEPRRGNALRWHSYQSNRIGTKPRKEKAVPKESVEKTKSGYTRHSGENAFVWRSNAEMIEKGEIITESELGPYIKKGDIILCENDKTLINIGIVTEHPRIDENTSHKIPCQFIPLLGKVDFTDVSKELTGCTMADRDKYLRSIAEVCPYIVNIEGISHLV